MAHFEMSRSTHVDAPPERLRALIHDFREWQKWSPWEGLDPELRRTFGGPENGVGSTYEWSGNSKAGAGRMEITESTPSRVAADLEFLKPFKASNLMSFALQPTGTGTDVTWTMTGTRSAVMGVLGKVYFDKAVVKDFDKGLAALKSSAEGA